ncbi:MAG: hypothetical protein AB7E36_02565 [Salinivirgaceae bacterium]
MKQVILVIILAFGFQMCINRDKATKLEVKLCPDSDSILTKYKNSIAAESIDINFKDSSLIDDTINRVHVLLFNPSNLPESAIDSVTFALAKELFNCLLNKNDFGRIEIDCIFDKAYFSNAYSNIVRSYNYNELE